MPSEEKPVLDVGTGKLVVFTGSGSVVILLFPLGGDKAEKLDPKFLVQATGESGPWNGYVFKSQLEVKGREKSYVATVNDQRFVPFIVQEGGAGTFFLPDSMREYPVSYHAVRSQENSKADLLASFKNHAKP